MKKVLVIDDEPVIVKMLSRLFDRGGFYVSTASNGEAALGLMSKDVFDVVVTDIIMPKKEGIELITTVKRDFPGTKIIAMSGGGRLSAKGYLRSAKILGADKVFMKPFDHNEMLSAVKELTGEG